MPCLHATGTQGGPLTPWVRCAGLHQGGRPTCLNMKFCPEAMGPASSARGLHRSLLHACSCRVTVTGTGAICNGIPVPARAVSRARFGCKYLSPLVCMYHHLCVCITTCV